MKDGFNSNGKIRELLDFLLTEFSTSGVKTYVLLPPLVAFETFATSATRVMLYSLIPVNGRVAGPDWPLGILFGLGGLLGMYYGAKLRERLSDNLING